MPKQVKNTSAPKAGFNPEAALSEAAASVSGVSEVNLNYIGPDYDLGIGLPGSHAVIRPREFSAEEVADFCENHPEYSSWWLPTEQ